MIRKIDDKEDYKKSGFKSMLTCRLFNGRVNVKVAPLPSETEADLLECAETFQDQTTYAQVTINGTAIENLDRFRIQSPPFNVTFPENNVFGIFPGPTQAVSDGIWIILKPLPPGRTQNWL
jgi:hypothetical protein